MSIGERGFQEGTDRRHEGSIRKGVVVDGGLDILGNGRIQPQDLFDDRVEVWEAGVDVVICGKSVMENRIDFLDQLLLNLRVGSKAVKGPAQCHGCGITTGDNEVQDDVFEVLICERLSILVGALHEVREDVRAIARSLLLSRGDDLPNELIKDGEPLFLPPLLRRDELEERPRWV